jgi:hypothetical protein
MTVNVKEQSFRPLVGAALAAIRIAGKPAPTGKTLD